MHLMGPEYLISQLNWRYAVKKFDPTKKISDSDWLALEEVLRLTPSSFGLQPWKFFVVQDPAIRKKLTPATWNQTQVEDCSHYIVFATLKKINEAFVAHYMKRISEVRGVPVESLDGFKNVIINDCVKGPRSQIVTEWNRRQSYIAMGSLMTSAALLQIDTCPLEGLEPTKYDEILGLAGGDYGTVSALACGYRHPEDKYQLVKKVRFEKNEMIVRI